jgi:hypothetical protein
MGMKLEMGVSQTHKFYGRGYLSPMPDGKLWNC